LGTRINNTNTKKLPVVNIYLLRICWKNCQFFDSSWSIFEYN